MMNIMHWLHAQIIDRREGDHINAIPQPYTIPECEETMRLLCKLIPIKHIDIVPEKFYRMNIYHDGQKFATVYAGNTMLYNTAADFECIESQTSRGCCECRDIFTYKKVNIYTVHDLVDRIVHLYKYIRIYEKYAIHMDDDVLSPFEHPEYMIAQLFDIIGELDQKLEMHARNEAPKSPVRNKHLYSKL